MAGAGLPFDLLLQHCLHVRPLGINDAETHIICTHHMGSDSINRYYAAPCLFGLPFGNGTALRSVKRSIFD
jgi:hypothetical protein